MIDPTEPDSVGFGYVPRRNRPGLLRTARLLVADVCGYALMGTGFLVGGAFVLAGALAWNTLGRP